MLRQINKYSYWNHNFKRKNFAVLQQNDIDYFKTFMSSNHVVTDI